MMLGIYYQSIELNTVTRRVIRYTYLMIRSKTAPANGQDETAAGALISIPCPLLWEPARFRRDAAPGPRVSPGVGLAPGDAGERGPRAAATASTCLLHVRVSGSDGPAGDDERGLSGAEHTGLCRGFAGLADVWLHQAETRQASAPRAAPSSPAVGVSVGQSLKSCLWDNAVLFGSSCGAGAGRRTLSPPREDASGPAKPSVGTQSRTSCAGGAIGAGSPRSRSPG